MKAESTHDNPWPRRLAGAAAGLFLIAALVQTSLIVFVLHFGQRFQLDEDSHQGAWYTFDKVSLETSELMQRKVGEIHYTYVVNGTSYERTIPWTSDWENKVSGNPLGIQVGHFEIAVCEQLPRLSVPILKGYNALSPTYFVWMVAVLSVGFYSYLLLSSLRSDARGA